MVRIFVLIFVLISSELTFSQNYWLRQNSPTTKNLKRCVFTDTLNGWAAGDSGIIVHTSNGGMNWFIQNSGVNFFTIDDIFFINKRLGWGISNYYYGNSPSLILKTINGGLNWSYSPFTDTTFFINTIYFLDSLNGWMGCYDGIILHTTNAGGNWTQLRSDSSWVSHFPIKRFTFYSPQFSYAAGGIFDIQGIVWKTSNYGQSWKTNEAGAEPLNQIVFIDSLRAIGIGGDYEYGASYVKTYDAGETWSYHIISYFGIARAISFRIPSEAWIATGVPTEWLFSADTGNTWRVIRIPDTCVCNDVLFKTPYSGWTVGDNGAILKYNAAVIPVIPLSNEIPERSELLQNYPNPFNPVTNIGFRISDFGLVTIKIFDLLGKEVETLVSQNLKPGSYEITWDGSKYPSGIYYYSLNVGKSSGEVSYTESKKMVLIK